MESQTTAVNGHTREYTAEDFDFTSESYRADSVTLLNDPTLQANGSRSLSSIAFHAFALGAIGSPCLLSTLLLAWHGNTAWRLPCFIGCLSLFHFLEFYITARYNFPVAKVSSFLLFTNGTAYNVAHTLATFEIIASLTILPTGYSKYFVHSWTIVLGLLLVVIGQSVRSIAMAQAGTNFNHTPVKERKEGHVLVTRGVYGWFRHPSYFGFFWWALGTQMLVGNKICLVGYAFVLWDFFRKRIRGMLKDFSTMVKGQDY